MLTFDRYLLRSFWHVLGVCVIATFGLVIVIDLLENLDDFLGNNKDRGVLSLIQSIGQYYAYQSIFFFDRAGPTMVIIAVMTVLILFQRSGELHPLLAAGVPMYRVLLPLLGASALVGGVILLNQEYVIPQIAHAAYAARGGGSSDQMRVEPIYDHASRISIDGKRLNLAERAIEQAEFVLPAPSMTNDLTILKAARAVQSPATADRPAGWKLEGVRPQWRELELTEAGLATVLPGTQPDELFVVTAVTCDLLYKRGSSYAFLSSRELLQRIHSPAFGATTAHRLIVHLHLRFLQPLLIVVTIAMMIPLLVRRESLGLVVDVAVSCVALAALFGFGQGCAYLGQTRVFPADAAAWAPVIAGGSLSAWFSGVIRT